MIGIWKNLGVGPKVIMATLVVMACLLGGGAYLLGQQFESDLNNVLATQAQIVEKQIRVTRAYVAKQFVVKAKATGMKVSMEHDAPDTIPFPATFTRETSEALAKEGIYNARVISETPLNPNNAPQDQFEKEAVDALKNGREEYIKTELVNGQMMFRRATVDLASVQACVGCHEGKQIGDMLGAVAVQIPMDAPMAQLNSNLQNMYWGIFGVGLLMMCLLYLAISRLVGKPLQALEGIAKEVSHGNLTARAEVVSQDEIGKLGQAFNTMAQEIEGNITQGKEFQGKMEAVSKAQAVIEFQMDGTILTANENFCQTVGYQLEEIQGKHHRMFADPDEANSPAYAAFWAKLNRGEFDAGVYRRLGKGGQEVWIQASYNPILDANDKPCKVVKFATDITGQKNAEIANLRIKTALDNASSNVLVCDRSYQIIYANKRSVQTMQQLEKEIQSVMPNFAVGKILGSNIDQYHKNPAHQRQLLDDPKNLPYGSEIQLGPLTLDLQVAAIMSEKGEYLGNVVEWRDVTAEKKAQIAVDHLIGAAAQGQLSERINPTEFEGVFKTISVSLNQLLDAVATPMGEAQSVLSSLASGDLSQTVQGGYEGEFDKIKTSLNGAIQNLSGIVQSVREGAEHVSTASAEITKGNEDLSQRTSAQAGALEETSASMEEMTSTIKQNADNAKQANQLAVTAREVAEKGGAVTDKAVHAMDEINKSSKKIADIINVIDEIAFQTNLLALNAAVEAARAGEQGRGFAVVASEVRNLAQRSATAAKEIKSLINESVQKVSDGSDLVNQSGQTLQEIVNSVKRVTDINCRDQCGLAGAGQWD